MTPDADSPEDIRLNHLLAHARRVTLAPGFSQRVLESLPEQAFSEPSHPSASRGSLPRAALLTIAASVVVAGVLWFASHSSPPPATEESWMSEFASGDFSAADLALIAQLHEVLEAEISTESNAAWAESGHR